MLSVLISTKIRIKLSTLHVVLPHLLLIVSWELLHSFTLEIAKV